MSSMKCGIIQIDKHLDGFNYGEMIISASRAGHGNFYFITSIVRGICYTAEDNPKCLIFTDQPQRNIKYFLPGDENIFTFYSYDCKDFPEFKNILSEQVSEHKPQIIIIENSEVSFNKNKEFYRHIKRLAAENQILTFIKGFINRKQERRCWYPPTVADIEGSPILEKLADKIIIMQRPEVLGIKDAMGGNQDGLADLVLFSYDLCTSTDSYIWYDKEKLIFENFDREKHRINRWP